MYTVDMSETGILSLVATPIGNLEDMTYRAVRTLSQAEYILCEDTRVTGKLLQRYEITSKMKRYDAHASERTHDSVVADVLAGKRIALVSDAGTPGVSDPGVLLVQQLRAAGGQIEVIPGPSAVIAAVSLAGFTGNQFMFLGFVPQKKGRETFFTSLATREIPVVFFESTHRIVKALQQLLIALPDKTIYVARELTKLHEECLIGSPSEILEILEATPVKQKGEFVIIVDPR